MNQEKFKSDEEIIEFLVESGFEEEKIKRAIRETKSKDFDAIIEYINTRIEGPPKINLRKTTTNDEANEFDSAEARRIIEENKKKNLLEKKYREELIRITMEERREFEKEDELKSTTMQVDEKTNNKNEAADCIIKVRLPGGDVKVIYFNKDQTVLDVFSKVEEIYGSKKFKMYKLNHPNPVESSNEKLQNCKLLYPRSMIIVEDE